MSSIKCKYFTKCGGCRLQHVDYELQISNKEKRIKSLLGIDELKVFQSQPYNYRNKLELLFFKGGLGLRAADSPSTIIEIDRCEVVEERLNELIKELKDFFKRLQIDSFDQKKGTGSFYSAIVRCSSESDAIIFVLNPDSSKLMEAAQTIDKFTKSTSAKNVAIYYNSLSEESFDDYDPENLVVVKGEKYITHNYLDFKFKYPVHGFFQNNHQVALEMQKYVQSLLEKYDSKNRTLLDLYSGVGTFGIFNSKRYEKIILAESFEEAVLASKENLVINNIPASKAESHCINLDKLKKLKIAGMIHAISDPPRVGMGKDAIDSLCELMPEVVIYVSCNPEELQKELKRFKDKGYELLSSAIFDMFPQTNHVETVIEMKRKIEKIK